MKPRRIFCAARLTLPFASALSVLAFSSTAHAQTTRYWDNNGTTGGFGNAGGTWADPTVSQWSTSAGGTLTPGASITTAGNDPLNFGTDTASNGLGGGTITVSGTVNSGNIKFGSQSTGAITLGGTGTINFGTAASSINVGAGTGTNHVISANISGASTSLSKIGPGGLTLSGNNTYTGTTIITAGFLQLASSTAASTNTIQFGTANNTELRLSGSGTNIANALSISAGSTGTKTLSLIGGTAVTYSGNITANENLTISGATTGTQINPTISGTNNVVSVPVQN